MPIFLSAGDNENCAELSATTPQGGVSDTDCATVIGVEPCADEQVTFTVGECDDFGLPTEVTSPSQVLLDWIAANYAGDSGTRDCDEDRVDQYWAYTFTALSIPNCEILSATLEIRILNGGGNDHLKIGFITGPNDSWEVNDQLKTQFGVDVGETETLSLDLSGVAGQNLLNEIA